MVQLVTSAQFGRTNPLDAFFRGKQQAQTAQLNDLVIKAKQGDIAAQEQLQILQQQVLGGGQAPQQAPAGSIPTLGAQPTVPGVSGIAGDQGVPVAPQQGPTAFERLQVVAPAEARNISLARKAAFDNQSDREQQRIQSIVQGAAEIQGLPAPRQITVLERRKQRLQAQGLPTNDTDEQLALLRSGRIDEANALTDQAAQLGGQLGLLEAPTEAKRTALVQNLKAAGFVEGTPEFEQELLSQLRKPGVSVTVGGKAEGKEREEIAKVRARQFEKLSDAADNAEATIASLDQLDAIGVETGALEPAKAAFAAVIEGFGIDASGITDVTTAQSLKSVSNRLVNDVLNAAKGPQTEGDAQRARSTIRNLGDDPKAGQFKSDSLRAVSLRAIEQRDFVDQLIDEGATFSKARAEWNKFKKKTPSLSAVIKDPNTKLPMFFFQFKQVAAQRRPGITDQEIIDAWRNAHGGS
ncbi:MAG: hypothetical protein V3V10_09465 [Planctomycetota bacterium]